MFAYSRRDKTHAAKHLVDDVLPDVKQRRLTEVIDKFREGMKYKNSLEVGKTHLVLCEGYSKKYPDMLCGRTDR